MSGRRAIRTMSEFKWADAEREAVEQAIYAGAEGVDPDERAVVTTDVLDALAPFVAAREEQAAAKALREVVEDA